MFKYLYKDCLVLGGNMALSTQTFEYGVKSKPVLI